MNHYKWLEKHFIVFLKNLGIKHPDDYAGHIVADGDKCYCYRDVWEKAGIPFHEGAAIYLLSYIAPYAKEVRQTATGWVDPCKWVVANYNRFKNAFPKEQNANY